VPVLRNCKTISEEIRITCRGADVIALDALVDFQGGLKKRTPRDLDAILLSILRFGFSFPFFVWQHEGTNYCLDGHGRIEALKRWRAQSHELPLFPVAYIEAADEAEAQQKLLRLNSQYGTMSVDSVLEFMGGLAVDFDELSLPGARLSFPTAGPATAGDDEFEMPALSGAALGDVFELSSGGAPHRLICGDSSDPFVIGNLMAGAAADLWLTDPPYNVDYTGKTKAALKIKNDHKTEEEFRAFLTASFRAAATPLRAGGSFYIWHADSEGLAFRSACRDAELKVRQCLIWAKNSMVMGRQDYQWQHEPCLYGWKDGAAHSWFVDRKQTTLLPFARPARSEEHPTMKPVDLFASLILNSTKLGELVLDTFLGSGTTLVACEKLGRICYGAELDPVYCDVIVRRFVDWCLRNGRTPTIALNGSPVPLPSVIAGRG